MAIKVLELKPSDRVLVQIPHDIPNVIRKKMHQGVKDILEGKIHFVTISEEVDITILRYN